jgi:hypothetical protein
MIRKVGRVLISSQYSIRNLRVLRTCSGSNLVSKCYTITVLSSLVPFGLPFPVLFVLETIH